TDTAYTKHDLIVSGIDHGDWLAVSSVDFEHGAMECVVHLASKTNVASIELRLDAIDGECVGQVAVPNTGGLDKWKKLSFPVQVEKGVYDLYFIFKGNSNQPLFEFASWSFNK